MRQVCMLLCLNSIVLAVTTAATSTSNSRFGSHGHGICGFHRRRSSGGSSSGSGRRLNHKP